MSQILKLKDHHFLYSGARGISYMEPVSSVQAIVLLHISRPSHDDLEDDPEHDNWVVWALARLLWVCAPTRLSSSLRPLAGVGVRRKRPADVFGLQHSAWRIRNPAARVCRSSPMN
ncbi:hypothetical protein F4801DRAFT_29670 [Xylaria longipes]|nr:hypothetical protein F4801DRAFT_29670 [Xylaria longipes]